MKPAHERAALAAADRFDRELGIRAQVDTYAARRFSGDAAGRATLHIDDVSGVPFLQDIVGVQFYQLRTRVRARTGDLYAAACAGIPDYEAYCRDRLGLGAPAFVQAAAVGPPIEVAEACRQGAAFDAIVAAAERAGALVIHPYMGIDAVWALADDVARAAGVEVQVLGPPPPVTWFANDKAHVTALANALVAPTLGTPSTVATVATADPLEMAEALAAMARRYPRVALKMTRFASAMGNRVFDSSALVGLARDQLEALVRDYLSEKAWAPGQVVLVVQWIDMAPSPSTQLWIPPQGQGEPTVEGIYEQLLEGPERVFLGSVPSSLSPAVHRWLEEASLLVARTYQALGYVGRCSFDFILDGDQPLFVECNGRWGGTSSPMHLVDRLFPNGRPAYRARDFVCEAWAGRSFGALAARLGDLLYDARTGQGRFVLYNVGCLEPFGKFDVIALGEDLADATHALEELLPDALG